MEVALVTSAKFQCSVYTVKSCEVSLSKKYRPISAYLWSLRLRAFLAVTKQWRHPQCWPTGCLIEQPHKDKVKDVQNVLKRRVACSHKVAKGLYIYMSLTMWTLCATSQQYSVIIYVILTIPTCLQKNQHATDPPKDQQPWTSDQPRKSVSHARTHKYGSTVVKYGRQHWTLTSLEHC